MEMNIDSVRKSACRQVAKAVKMYVTPLPFGWPPVSTGYFYQPKRPMALHLENNAEDKEQK